MDRRKFLTGTAVASATALFLQPSDLIGGSPGAKSESHQAPRKLTPPGKGENIHVAIVVSEGAEVIDFAGPWEVFQDVHVPDRGSTMEERMPFRLFTVSDEKQPIQTSGGLKILPDFTFADAPAPRVVVVPAQGGRSDAMKNWLREQAKTVDVLMSVCTGAFVLGDAGLLSGLRATTHHGAYDAFARRFPDVELVSGRRFVENEVISTAGGLTSGIDLALHVVERYYGREIARHTAEFLEYQGTGWMT